MIPAPHPLYEVFKQAAQGEMPAADGSVEIVPPASRFVNAVIAFTARNYIAADVDAAWVHSRVAPDPIARPMSLGFLLELQQKLGLSPRTGVVDAVFARMGGGPEPDLDLVELDRPIDHPRLARSLEFRDDVQAFQTPDESALLILGRGIAGRLEVAFEVQPEYRGRGLGRRVLAAGVALAGEGEALFAEVAPGNAASVRAVLACGFRPIGAEFTFQRS